MNLVVLIYALRFTRTSRYVGGKLAATELSLNVKFSYLGKARYVLYCS